MKKKLQVFISSTYSDLQEERQAAVAAVLDAGHIPAGMELFKAGNSSQLETIKKWIDESDVYMLILGGRYGSIEPRTNKSYTQFEYEYAISKGIPVFSIVLNETLLYKKAYSNSNINFFEKERISDYNDFKKVVLNRIVRFIDDVREIKSGVLSSLYDFEKNPKISGWVREKSEVSIESIMHKCYKCDKEEILPNFVDPNSLDHLDIICKIDMWHEVDAGNPGYGSVLDSLNLKFELCDECLNELIESFKLKSLIYQDDYDEYYKALKEEITV